MEDFHLDIVERAELEYFKRIEAPHLFVPSVKDKDRDRFTRHIHKCTIVSDPETKEFLMWSDNVENNLAHILISAPTVEEVKKKYFDAFLYTLTMMSLIEMPGVKEKMKAEFEAKERIRVLYRNPTLGE